MSLTSLPPLPIPETYWVIPGQFLAGEYPGSWENERTRRRLDLFLEAGFNTFIDLTSEGELLPYNPILSERATIYGVAVTHQRLTIGDFTTPTVTQMKIILDVLDDSLKVGRKVYLHCWGGVGRTGTTVGCFLVRHGKTGEEALAQLASWWQHVPKRAQHPRSPETDEQVALIRDWKAGQ
jgi:Polymorphic toxin system, DSP-PTPase phosphatase